MNESFLPPAPLPPPNFENQIAHFPSTQQQRSRLKELQHQLLIKRVQGLLMQAEAGEIDGLLVVVQNSELSVNKDASQYLWLDGSYRTNPSLAHAALLHGVTELFNKFNTNTTDQLRLDLK